MSRLQPDFRRSRKRLFFLVTPPPPPPPPRRTPKTGCQDMARIPRVRIWDIVGSLSRRARLKPDAVTSERRIAKATSTPASDDGDRTGFDVIAVTATSSSISMTLRPPSQKINRNRRVFRGSNSCLHMTFSFTISFAFAFREKITFVANTTK